MKRDFTATGPNQLWVTDITEHPTREGRVFCCVVLDAYSRKAVGWSIDRIADAALVNSALNMAAATRSTTREPSFMPITALNLPQGLSRATCVITDSNSAWERSVIAMTMP